MPIQPKHSLGQLRPRATRQFTDRTDFLRLFQENIQVGRLSDYKILVFYGVGGIGKTSMRKEMARMLDATPAAEVYACLDFDVPSYRDQETALFVLRKELKGSFKVGFPTFDLAYAIYWQKIHPQTAMNEETLPILKDSDMIGEIAGLLGAVPLVGLVPKLALAAVRGGKLLHEWWTKRGAQELRDLPDLEPAQIAERLPMFWGADLRDHMARHEVPGVLFLDTYEGLWEAERSEGKFHSRDEWVRELVSQLPEVLWVMFGREKLRWAEIDEDWNKHIEQRLVGGLAPADSRTFLATCGISRPEVTEAILEGSQGVPYYLDLAVDTYFEIKERLKQEPVPGDFAATPREIFARFLRYLNQSEIETLKLLSVPRFWDYDLFELLVTKYHTGYPLTAFADLCRFSFVQEKTEDSWSLHQLMRESLREHMVAELNRKVHQTLFDYYNAIITGITVRDVAVRHKLALAEAFYHARTVLPGEQLVNWLDQVYRPFYDAAQYQLLTGFYSETSGIIERTLGSEHPAFARALDQTAELLRIRGNYAAGEPLCRQALQIREKALGPAHPDVATSLNNLVAFYHCRGDDEEAEPLCRRAIEIRQALPSCASELADSLTNLGVLYSAQGRFSEAEPLLRQALEKLEDALGPDHPELFAVLNSLAGVLDVRGKRAEAETLLRRAIAICEKSRGSDHPDLATSLNSLALLYRNQHRYAEAEPLQRRAMEIREEALGAEHPETVASLTNLCKVYHYLSRDAEAEPLCRKALGIRERVLGPAHRDTATSLDTLAVIRQAQGDFVEAEALGRRALAIWEKSLRPGHRVIAIALCNLASVCVAQGKLADAEPLYQRALSIREQALGPDHASVAEVLDSLALLYDRTGRTDLARQARERAAKIRAVTNPA